MGVNIRTEYWYGIKFDLSNDDWYAKISEFEEENEDLEWKIDVEGERFGKYITLQQSTYYESVDPYGIGVDIGHLSWGQVVEADKLSFELKPAVKEAADEWFDKMGLPGERKVYVHTVMC